MSENNTHSVAALQEYQDDTRLDIYRMLTNACTHLYSKGKLQKGKFDQIALIFADLAKNDPLFMAHLAAWAHKQDSKDLKVLSVFFNALSDADGTPFFEGASANKPNLREVSYALLQKLDPHLAHRVLTLCHEKFGVDNLLNYGRHFPTGFRTAYRKYLKYRENNPDMLRGARRTGLGKKLRQMYRLTHTAPSDDAVTILGWEQKDGRVPEKNELPDFTDKTTEEIVKELQSSKISPMVALSTIPQENITASVAKALLGNATGNQSIILYNWFSRNGFLDVPEINALFKGKIQEATTAVDRIDTLTRNADEEDKVAMAQVRSKKRKKDANLSSLGKIYLHIDASSSMNEAIAFAKERATIIAECVDNPSENFGWGLFNNRATPLPVPQDFTKEGFHSVLYYARAGGQTDCIALYEDARRFGANVDIYITDQEHNIGSIRKRINDFHDSHPEYVKPKAAVVVDYSNNRIARDRTRLVDDLQHCGIPVSVIRPEALTESALVAQSVRNAIAGEMKVIEEIMETPLPSLPEWYKNKEMA